ncbi:hypothetical protein JHK86_001570 [Glycine max]|nr:hypothetical protein JHK86_001570 [Glycine max]
MPQRVRFSSWELPVKYHTLNLSIHKKLQIRVPYPFQWGAPTFDASEAFAMMMASFVALVESLSKINLSSNALSGSIPDFIGDFPSICFVDLSKNGFTVEIPSALFTYCYKTNNFYSKATNDEDESPPDLSSKDIGIMKRRIANVLEPGETLTLE